MCYDYSTLQKATSNGDEGQLMEGRNVFSGCLIHKVKLIRYVFVEKCRKKDYVKGISQ
jgi:hypothetical protein